MSKPAVERCKKRIDPPPALAKRTSIRPWVAYRQMYAGRLVAKDGKIQLLRESLDTVAAAKAFAPIDSERGQ